MIFCLIYKSYIICFCSTNPKYFKFYQRSLFICRYEWREGYKGGGWAGHLNRRGSKQPIYWKAISSIQIFSIQLERRMNTGAFQASSSKGFKNVAEKSHVIINQRYRLCSLRRQHGDYNMYQGIDLQESKWVHIYLKLKSSSYPLSKAVRDNLKTQLCPKVVDAGEVDILKYKYFFQIHEKFGPSLETLFSKISHQITGKELLHLLLEMIKLIQKIDNVKLVCGELSPGWIVFDLNPRKTDLYLLNCFNLKKRHQTGRPMRSRFCSRGAHLGRNISIKDDLESACYILIDAFTQGGFMKDHDPAEYSELKLSLKIQEFAQGLPQPFIDFYYYVISLNYAEDINYFYWKTTLTKILTQEVLAHPYRFLVDKSDSSVKSEKREVRLGDFEDIFQEQTEDEKESKLSKMQRTLKSNEKFKNREG